MDNENLEGHASGNNGIVAITGVIKDIRKKDQNRTNEDVLSSVQVEDNTSRPFIISQEDEQRLVQEMREVAQAEGKPMVAEADRFWLVATLVARKGDVKRAVLLADNYLQWREKVDYESNTPAKSASIREIMSDDLFVCAGNESRDGRPVLAIRYKYFNPRKYSALDTVRAFGYIVEWMLRTYPKAQTHGIVVVEDTDGFSLKNFDIRLISFLEKALSKTLPIRVSALHITNPGIIIKAMFTLFASFFNDKLKTRIRLFGKGEEDKFAQYFAPEQNFKFLNLGGTLEWTAEDRKQLTERIVTDFQNWPPATTFE